MLFIFALHMHPFGIKKIGGWPYFPSKNSLFRHFFDILRYQCIIFSPIQTEQLAGVRNSAAFELGVGVGVLSRLLYDVCYILHTINKSAEDSGNNPPVAASVVGKENDLFITSWDF